MGTVKRCKLCGHVLRTRESIERGFGLVCFKKLTGKKKKKPKKKFDYMKYSNKPLKRAKEIPPLFEKEYFFQHCFWVGLTHVVPTQKEEKKDKDIISQLSFFDN